MELKWLSTGIVKAGKTKSKKLSYSFPVSDSASCQYVIAVIDADNAVEEISETNNQVVYFFDNGECTDTIPPSVILTSPAWNATGVSVNTMITAYVRKSDGRACIWGIPLQCRGRVLKKCP